MKDHTGCERGYYWTSKAWYAAANNHPKEVTFGMFDTSEGGGGTSGEMQMRWHDLGGAQLLKWNALKIRGVP